MPSFNFTPIVYPSPARHLEVNMGHAVLNAYLEMHSEFKEIITDPNSSFPKLFRREVMENNHWTTKVEKGKIVPQGRITIYPSNPPQGEEPLNGEIQNNNNYYNKCYPTI